MIINLKKKRKVSKKRLLDNHNHKNSGSKVDDHMYRKTRI